MNPKVRIMHINDGIRYFDKLELKFKNIWLIIKTYN